MQFSKLTDLDLRGKKVFIRTDMNVPLADGQITDATRIRAGAATIIYALEQGAQVIVATHLGRPREGELTSADSVAPVAAYLAQLLGRPVPVVGAWASAGVDFSQSQIVMLENVRGNVGEKANSQELGQAYAQLCDVFCYDAFATAHRAEASTNAIGNYAKEVCAGLLMSQELEALTRAVAQPATPVVAIVAGSKVSTKLTILANLAAKVDVLIVGGGILNTFLAASGAPIGASLAEPELIEDARQIMANMAARGAQVPLPREVVVAQEFSAEAIATTKAIAEVAHEDMILDIGTSFAHDLAAIIAKAGTVIWNGPLGVFEFDQFAKGTQLVATAIAEAPAFSLAGGGDTFAAINKFGLWPQISYVSTAGGALLEFLEGKQLPALALLAKHAAVRDDKFL